MPRKPKDPTAEPPDPGPIPGQPRQGNKTVCPVTRQEFNDTARPVKVMIGDSPMVAGPREFSTGSLGWYINGKTVLRVGDTDVTVQVGINLTVVGSKELPKG